MRPIGHLRAAILPRDAPLLPERAYTSPSTIHVMSSFWAAAAGRRRQDRSLDPPCDLQLPLDREERGM
jgi:hypothetical protein